MTVKLVRPPDSSSSPPFQWPCPARKAVGDPNFTRWLLCKIWRWAGGIEGGREGGRKETTPPLSSLFPSSCIRPSPLTFQSERASERAGYGNFKFMPNKGREGRLSGGDIQGCTEGTFPDCVNLVEKLRSVYQLQAGQSNFFQHILTQPGKVLFMQPCIGLNIFKSILPFTKRHFVKYFLV